MTILVFSISLLVVILLGMPISIALLVSGTSLLVYMDLFDTLTIAKNLISGANNFSLTAIPFFILAGEIMNSGGISKRIVSAVMKFLGHVHGGLGYVAIVAGILLAGLSGSAVADTAALGAILIPMMTNVNYDRARATGLVASSGIIAPIIPPSIPMIIFGVTSGVSISSLFIAGIVPGIIFGLGLAVVWAIVVKNEKVETFPKRSWRDRLYALREGIWAILLPIIIIVGLRGGIFTPTEAGAVAAFYALIVSLFIYWELKIKDLYKVLIVSAKTTSVVMFLVATAMVLGWAITVSDIPMIVNELVDPFVGNRILLMVVIVALILIVGTAMDLTPAILILTPILMPVVSEAGIDPVYFGVVFVITASIGLLTPPVGTVLNVACGVSKISMEDFLKGVWPFLFMQIFVLILLLLFPSIVLGQLEWFVNE